MEPNRPVEEALEGRAEDVAPVRSHEDVLGLIEEVERQLERLRSAQHRSAEEVARREIRHRELESREALLAAREQDLARGLEAIRGEADRVAAERARVETLSCELESARAALDAERDAIAQAKAAHETSESTARAEAETLSRTLAERDAALRAVEERLADAESSLRSRDEVYERRERELDAMRDELESRERQRDELEKSLAVAKEKLSRLAQTVAQHAPQLEEGAAAIARAAEFESTIAALRERVSDLESRLAGAADAREVDSLRATIERLEGELASAREGASAAADTRGLDAARRRLAEFGLFLRTRKARLAKARHLLRERDRWTRAKTREQTEAAVARALEEERLLAKQKEELRQVQEMIAASEERVLRRDGRGRVLVGAGFWTLVAIAAAIGSWFAAGSIAPTPVVASVDLVARGRDDAPLAPDVDAVFQASYRELLADEAFRAVVRRRLEERGLSLLADERVFPSWMDSIRADSDGAGSLRLVAEGTDELPTILALDTVATSLVNESARVAKGRSDLPRIALVGQTSVPGRSTFSTAVMQQDPKDRIVIAGLLFSGVIGLGFAGSALIFGRLARAKRRFEESEPG